jgi:hypothetical protein
MKKQKKVNTKTINKAYPSFILDLPIQVAYLFAEQADKYSSIKVVYRNKVTDKIPVGRSRGYLTHSYLILETKNRTGKLSALIVGT